MTMAAVCAQSIADPGGDISKIHNVLFYAQCVSRHLYAEDLFEGRIEADDHGPFVVDFYDVLERRCGGDVAKFVHEYRGEEMTAQQAVLMECVHGALVDVGAGALAAHSRENREWIDVQRTMRHLPPGVSEPVPTMTCRCFPETEFEHDLVRRVRAALQRRAEMEAETQRLGAALSAQGLSSGCGNDDVAWRRHTFLCCDWMVGT